jgi:aryl-alcohol dehydrogenase-like predicted oxidoreductase
MTRAAPCCHFGYEDVPTRTKDPGRQDRIDMHRCGVGCYSFPPEGCRLDARESERLMNSNSSRLLGRRAVLQGVAAGGVSFALGASVALGEVKAPLPLITKIIPSTGEKLPVVGIGTNQYSVSAPEELAARREVLRELPHLGGKLVDTAWGYGDAEIVIGGLVKDLGNRDSLFIATKTPIRGVIPSGAAVVEQALRRLQTSRIDLLQIHNFHGAEELFPVLVDAKRTGKIRYIGVTTSSPDQHPQLLAVLNSRQLDFIQVDYSIEDQTAEGILQVARDKGVAVLINVPLGGRRGSLLTKVQDKPLPDFAKEIDAGSWAQLLLKYTIAHPAVTAVIPGTTKLAHLQDNQLAARGRLPDAPLRKKIEAYWAGL